MASALQQQLAVIAANSTHQLDLKAQKARHAKSLLFEPREAATQTFETIYQVCIEGFEELCALDARFEPFSRNLFSEQSMNEDRSMMTTEESASLDNTIERFLGLVGGRLLLKPAIKATDWLVRRFKIHEYNTEILLLTFLPYQSSHIFPTLLSILPGQLPPNFRFLHPYVTALQSPPRYAVVSAMSSNANLLAAFGQYVLGVTRARHHSAVLLRYWASITAQAVNNTIDASRSGREAIRKQKEEDILLKIIPILQQGMEIQGVPELYLGLCMIIVIITNKITLNEKVVNALMEAVASAWSKDTIQEGITCLALLAEEKEEPSLPRPVVRAILKQEEFLGTIYRIGETIRLEKLLTGASIGAVDMIISSQDARASQLVVNTLRSHDVLDECKVRILEAAVGALDQAQRGGSASTELLNILTTCVEQDDGSRLLSLAITSSGKDIAQLDGNLALLLTPDGGEEVEQFEPMLLDEPHDATQSTLDLSTLPSLGEQTSFLDSANQDLFVQYGEAFQKALPSTQDLSALFSLPALQMKSCTKRPGLLSFLARTWTSQLANPTRLKALQTTTELLQQIRKDNDVFDLQALIPYLIAALADPAKIIRSSAASALLALNDLYSSSATGTKTKGALKTWCKETLYGKHSLQLQYLQPAECQRLLSDALLPILEDCVIDSNYVVSSLIESINASSAASKHSRKELKSSIRTAIYDFFLSHVVASPATILKLRLLSILNKIGKAAGQARTQKLLPYLKEYVSATKDTSELFEVVTLTKALLESVTQRTDEELQCLKTLSTAGSKAGNGRSRLAFGRLGQLWSTMKDSARIELVDWLLSLSLDDGAPEDVQSGATELLTNLHFSTGILVHLVESLPCVSDFQRYPTPAKKQRTSRTSETSRSMDVDKQKLSAAVRKITTVLELVEESKPERHLQLLKGLFHFLGELHHYKIATNSELIYLQNIVVNSLLCVVNGLKNAPDMDVDRSVIRADLIVDCVRTTSNVQVHHAALLLMSALASWAPELVLHSVMPLFTFMSSTILKQSDEYSAHVTDQTVARIIPPLAVSLKKRGKDLITGAAELLLSFTAAFEHIPLHRRAALFQHLVQTLGPQEALFAVVAMLIERYPDDSNAQSFVGTLMEKFSSTVQLHAVRQYLDLVFDTLKPLRSLSDVILGYSEKTSEETAAATSVLLEGLANILSRDGLRKKLAKELKKDDADAENMREVYSRILEKTMELGLQLKTDAVLRDGASDVLTALLGLMPTKDFIDSSALLMQRGSHEIRRQVFASLEQRANTAKRGDAAMQRIFTDVLPNCVLFIDESQPMSTRLAAIGCVDCIAKRFGKTDRPSVLLAVEKITGDAALASDDDDLRRMSLLCLSSMVEVLEDEFVSVVPRTVRLALQYLEETLSSDGEIDEDLPSACFAFAIAILDHIPWVLAGRDLDRFLICAADAEEYDNSHTFANLAARKIAPQEMFGCIDRTWESVCDTGVEGLRLVLDTCQVAVQTQSKANISKHSRPLFTVIQKAFDLRCRYQSAKEDALEEAHLQLFELVNRITMDAVLKLNDNTFRPFFIRLIETASAPGGNDTVYKLTSLFSFTLVFFDQLKSLVTTYMGYLLEDISKQLQRLSPGNKAERYLLALIVKTLEINFANDQDGYWQTPSHFDAVDGPLLNLLSQATLCNAEDTVIPAIKELASAVKNSPDHLKTLNTIIMKYMRHEESAVRLAAIKTERVLTESLDIEWCNFIPEWVPYISDLQEDDEGLVERETLRWMKQIQEVTGEDMNDMMR